MAPDTAAKAVSPKKTAALEAPAKKTPAKPAKPAAAGCHELVIRIRTIDPEASWLIWGDDGRLCRGIQTSTGTNIWLDDDCVGRVVITIRGPSEQHVISAWASVTALAMDTLAIDEQDMQMLGPRVVDGNFF